MYSAACVRTGVLRQSVEGRKACKMPVWNRGTAQKRDKDTAKPQKNKINLVFIAKKSYLCAQIFLDMSVKLEEVTVALERIAPLPLQEGYDNAGLQIGLTGTDISGVLLCLDVTEEVLREAVDLDCNLVVSHHPLLFSGLKRVGDASQVERCVRLAIENGIAVYSAHTNLDNAEDGVNYEAAERLGLMDVELVAPRRVTVCIDGRETQVRAGSGIVGHLAQEEDSLAFLQRVKQVFQVECLMHNELLGRPVQSVVFCGGAGDFLLPEALKMQADAFLTGEMHYHRFFGHEQEIQIGVLGHYQSERFTIDLLCRMLGGVFPELPMFVTQADTNPVKYL